MTLDQLRIFLAVAEREHVTRAAEALNLTQSATSAAIAALEARHAVRLFDRIGRRIVLTEAGKILVREARAVLARAELAERALEDLAGLSRGHLRIAASQTVANYWLPERLARYRAAWPGIEISVRIGNSEEAARAVRDLDADLGVIENACRDALLEARELAGDRMVMVVPTHAPDPRPDPAGANWVLREPGSGTRAAFDAWLAGRGVDPGALNGVLELPSNEAVLAAVEAGAGASILSWLVAARSVETDRTRALPVELPQRPFRLLRHRERRLTAAETAFVSIAEGRDPPHRP